MNHQLTQESKPFEAVVVFVEEQGRLFKPVFILYRKAKDKEDRLLYQVIPCSSSICNKSLPITYLLLYIQKETSKSNAWSHLPMHYAELRSEFEQPYPPFRERTGSSKYESCERGQQPSAQTT